MIRLPATDVVIAGGGWTGLLMAKELAQRTALKVTVLERGPRRKTADYASAMDELDYALRLRMMQNAAEETVTHRHTVRDAAAPMRQWGSFLPVQALAGRGSTGTEFHFAFCPMSSSLVRT